MIGCFPWSALLLGLFWLFGKEDAMNRLATILVGADVLALLIIVVFVIGVFG